MEEPALEQPVHPRRKDVLIVVAIVVLGILLLAGTNAYLNSLRERALAGDWHAAVGNIRIMLMAAGALVAASTLALGAMLWRIGGRTLADERFPPPGYGISAANERVGAGARRLGRFLQVSAALVVLAGLGVAAVALFFAPLP